MQIGYRKPKAKKHETATATVEYDDRTTQVIEAIADATGEQVEGAMYNFPWEHGLGQEFRDVLSGKKEPVPGISGDPSSHTYPSNNAWTVFVDDTIHAQLTGGNVKR